MVERRAWGVSDPLSVAQPTADDLEAAKEMAAVVTDAGALATEAASRAREQALELVQATVDAWLRRFTGNASVSGRVLPFGSYRLGVHNDDGDLDLVCVVPSLVQRSDFFDSFVGALREAAGFAAIHCVSDAFVPLIKATCRGVHVDLLCCRVNAPELPSLDELHHTKALRLMDDKSMLSLAGYRVGDEILQLVPNVDVLREALRFVKLWARARGLYGNAYGFLGGISWTILVARACQLYVNGNSSVVVAGLFRVLTNWGWTTPIILAPVEERPDSGLRSWNPSNPTDRRHVMKVITPGFPHVNSTFNMSMSTLALLQREFRRADQLCTAIALKRATWKQLVEPPEVFAMYPAFLRVQIQYLPPAPSDTDPDTFHEWHAFVKSRLRLLVQQLEQYPTLSEIRLWPKWFEPAVQPAGKRVHVVWYFIGMLPRRDTPPVDLSAAATSFQAITSAYQRMRDGMRVGMDVCSGSDARQVLRATASECEGSPGPRAVRPRYGGDSSSSSPEPDVLAVQQAVGAPVPRQQQHHHHHHHHHHQQQHQQSLPVPAGRFRSRSASSSLVAGDGSDTSGTASASASTSTSAMSSAAATASESEDRREGEAAERAAARAARAAARRAHRAEQRERRARPSPTSSPDSVQSHAEMRTDDVAAAGPGDAALGGGSGSGSGGATSTGAGGPAGAAASAAKGSRSKSKRQKHAKALGLAGAPAAVADAVGGGRRSRQSPPAERGIRCGRRGGIQRRRRAQQPVGVPAHACAHARGRRHGTWGHTLRLRFSTSIPAKLSKTTASPVPAPASQCTRARIPLPATTTMRPRTCAWRTLRTTCALS